MIHPRPRKPTQSSPITAVNRYEYKYVEKLWGELNHQQAMIKNGIVKIVDSRYSILAQLNKHYLSSETVRQNVQKIVLIGLP